MTAAPSPTPYYPSLGDRVRALFARAVDRGESLPSVAPGVGPARLAAAAKAIRDYNALNGVGPWRGRPGATRESILQATIDADVARFCASRDQAEMTALLRAGRLRLPPRGGWHG